MQDLEDICKVRVKCSEIDSMCVAWHGSYVAYLEDGRESFGRHYEGIGYATMQEAGIYAPIYDMHIKYFASLRINDVAEIHTHYVHKRGARFIDPQGQLMIDKPDYYKAWQKKYLTK